MCVKLGNYGVRETLVYWFRSFLSNRLLAVKYNNFISDYFSPTSGVPQESPIGPLAFIIFINGIILSVKFSRLSLYAR